MSENITTKPNGSVRKNINRVVAKKNGIYYGVDDLFYHDDEFMGATGTRLGVITQEEHERLMGNERDPEYEYGHMADFYAIMVRDETTELEYEEWLDGFTDWEIEELIYDPSGAGYWDEVKELFEREEPDLEFYTTDCIGGGRQYTHEPQEYDVIYDQELLAEVRAIEAGEIPEWVRE